MPTLALAMIVRDAEAHLAACLSSAREWVDEMVIADTGSRDRTVAIALDFGARVLSIPWEDDFAGARNLGLAQVESDWVLVLDADERLDAGEAGAWRAQLHLATQGPQAYQTTIRNYVRNRAQRLWDRPARANDGAWAEAAEYPAYVEHENVRLFRRRPEIRFSGRVHESVGPSVLAAGLGLGRARGRIHHFGLALDAETTAGKNRLYRELGRRKVEEQPENAQAHFELGLVEFDNFHNDAAALRSFERACRLAPDFALAWFFSGLALQRLGQHETALAFLDQAAGLGYQTSIWMEMRADILYSLGRYAEAARGYERAGQAGGPKRLELASKRGLAELRSGDVQSGLQRLRYAVRQEPSEATHHDRLVAAHVWMENWEAAAASLAGRIRQFPQQAESYLRAASVLRAAGRGTAAAQCLAEGQQRLPDDATLARAAAELASGSGD